MAIEKRKIMVSGSDAAFSSLFVDQVIDGTSSFSETSSFAHSIHQGGVNSYVGSTDIDINNEYGGIFLLDMDTSSSIDVGLLNPKHGGMYVLHLYNGADTTVNFVSGSYYFVDKVSSLSSVAVDDEMIVFYCSSSNLYSNLYSDSNKHVNDVPYDDYATDATTSMDIDTSGSARLFIKLDTQNLTAGDTPVLNFQNMPTLGAGEASTITLHIIESTGNSYTFSIQKDGSAKGLYDVNGTLFSGTNNNEFTVDANSGSLFNIIDRNEANFYTDKS